MKYRNYTLLEVLAVVAILILIASIVTPLAINRMGKARHDTAKIKISSLEEAIGIFKLDFGRLPESLRELREDNGDDRWHGPYWDKSFKDPWGNEFIYVNPGEHKLFDLISYGADGRPGGEGNDSDVVNWFEEE